MRRDEKTTPTNIPVAPADFDQHLRKLSEQEERVADAMEELELLHRAMGTEPWIKDLPLDLVSLASMYLSRALAARRIETLGCYGAEECGKATGESSRSVRMALDRENQEIARLLKAQRTNSALN